MAKAQIISFWTNGVGNFCDVARFIGPNDFFSDVTGQASPPEAPVVVEVEGDSATIDAIIADGSYGAGALMWRDDV